MGGGAPRRYPEPLDDRTPFWDAGDTAGGEDRTPGWSVLQPRRDTGSPLAAHWEMAGRQNVWGLHCPLADPTKDSRGACFLSCTVGGTASPAEVCGRETRSWYNQVVLDKCLDPSPGAGFGGGGPPCLGALHCPSEWWNSGPGRGAWGWVLGQPASLRGGRAAAAQCSIQKVTSGRRRAWGSLNI